MKVFDPATSAYLARRAGNRGRILIHFWAPRKSDGVIEGAGIWNGEADFQVSIGGMTRTYLRSPGSIEMDEVMAQPGTDVIMSELGLTPLDEALRQAIALYDLRFAPIEIHRALFWPDSGDLVAEPVRLFKGWIDRSAMPMAEVGGQSRMTLTLASANRALTRALPFKKSDPALSGARGDRLRRYADLVSVTTPWGEVQVTS